MSCCAAIFYIDFKDQCRKRSWKDMIGHMLPQTRGLRHRQGNGHACKKVWYHVRQDVAPITGAFIDDNYINMRTSLVLWAICGFALGHMQYTCSISALLAPNLLNMSGTHTLNVPGVFNCI